MDEAVPQSAVLETVYSRKRKRTVPKQPVENDDPDWSPSRGVLKRLNDEETHRGPRTRNRGLSCASRWEGVFITRESLDSVRMDQVEMMVRLLIEQDGLQRRTFVECALCARARVLVVGHC